MINKGGGARLWKGRLVNNTNRKGTKNDSVDYNWEAFRGGLEGRRCFYFTNKAGSLIPGRRSYTDRKQWLNAARRPGEVALVMLGIRAVPPAFNCGFSTYLRTFPCLIRPLMPHHPFALVNHRVPAGTSPQSRASVRGGGRKRPHRLTVRRRSACLPCVK